MTQIETMTDFSAPFQLANIKVDPQTDQLSCGDSTLAIQSMAMKVLCYFAANQSQVISRDQLREQVWQNSTASNHTINNHIYSLRRTLAKLDNDTRFIHTVTGSNGNGYRLLVPVLHLTTNSLNNATLNDADDTKSHTTNEIEKPKQQSVVSNRISSVESKFTFNNTWLLGSSVLILMFIILMAGDWFTPQAYNQVMGLTFEQGREQSPAISADGTIVLYSQRPNRQATWELYALELTPNLTPKRKQKIFAVNGNDDNFVSISPNSKKLAFNRLVRHQEGIYVAEFNPNTLTAATAKRVIALDRHNLSPAISWLDNQRFFYTAKEAAKAPLRIYLHDLSTQKTEQVSSPPLNIFGDFAIMLSPDKRWLAVMRAEGYMGFALYLYDVANKSLLSTQVKGKEQRLNISFSDDSSEVYFIDEQGLLSAYHINDKTIDVISTQPYLGYWPLKIPHKTAFIMQQDWGLSSLTTQIMRYQNPLISNNETTISETNAQSLLVNNGLSIRAIEGIGNDGLIFASIKPNFHIELWRYQQGKVFKLEQFHEKPQYRYPLSIDWLAGSNKALLSINNSCRLVDTNTGLDSPLCPAGQTVYGGTFGISANDDTQTKNQSSQNNKIFLAGFRNDNSVAIKMGSSGYPFTVLKHLPDASIVKQQTTEQKNQPQIFYRTWPQFDIYHHDPETNHQRLLIKRHYLNHGYSSNDFVVVSEGIYYIDKPPGQSSGVFFYRFDDESTVHVINSPNEYPNIAISEDQRFIYQIQSVDNDSQLLLISDNDLSSD